MENQYGDQEMNNTQPAPQEPTPTPQEPTLVSTSQQAQEPQWQSTPQPTQETQWQSTPQPQQAQESQWQQATQQESTSQWQQSTQQEQTSQWQSQPQSQQQTWNASPSPAAKQSTMATASMVLGIAGLVLSCCCCLGMAASGVAIILALISKTEDELEKNAKVGLITGIIGLALSIIMTILWFVFYAIGSAA